MLAPLSFQSASAFSAKSPTKYVAWTGGDEGESTDTRHTDWRVEPMIAGA